MPGRAAPAPLKAPRLADSMGRLVRAYNYVKAPFPSCAPPGKTIKALVSQGVLRKMLSRARSSASSLGCPARPPGPLHCAALSSVTMPARRWHLAWHLAAACRDPGATAHYFQPGRAPHTRSALWCCCEVVAARGIPWDPASICLPTAQHRQSWPSAPLHM